MRATPVDGVYPGVEVHANLVAGMLDGNLKSQPGYVLGIDVLVLLLVGAIMIFVLPLLSPVLATATTIVVAMAVTGLNVSLWSSPIC